MHARMLDALILHVLTERASDVLKRPKNYLLKIYFYRLSNTLCTSLTNSNPKPYPKMAPKRKPLPSPLSKSLKKIEKQQVAIGKRTQERVAHLMATIPPESNNTFVFIFLFVILALSIGVGVATKNGCACTCSNL